MHPPPAKPSLLSWIQQEPGSTPFQQDLPQNQSNQQLGSLSSTKKHKFQRQRPFSRSNPSSLLERLSPQIRSSSLPFLPTSPSLTTLTSSLLSRITPEGLQPHKPNPSLPTSEQDKGQSKSDVEFFSTPSIPRDTRRQHFLESKSGDAEEGSKKHHRTSVHEELFPWRGTSAVL